MLSHLQKRNHPICDFKLSLLSEGELDISDTTRQKRCRTRRRRGQKERSAAKTAKIDNSDGESVQRLPI